MIAKVSLEASLAYKTVQGAPEVPREEKCTAQVFFQVALRQLRFSGNISFCSSQHYTLRVNPAERIAFGLLT